MATAIKPLTDWSAAQASPWNTVNANSDALNLRASGSVKDKDLTSPPGSPSDKDAYIVGASATGAWAGEDGNIAVYDSTAAGWDFYAPYEGMRLWLDDEDRVYAYTGSEWRPSELREVLTAARTYYVDGTLGSDSNDGLSSGSGAFATLQKAIDTVAALDTSVYDVTISVADATYAENVVLSPVSGAGFVTVTGNTSTPANVDISPASGNCVDFSATGASIRWLFDGFRVSGTGHGFVGNSGSIRLDNIDFNNTGQQINAYNLAVVDMIGGSFTVPTGAVRFINSAVNATVNALNSTITFSGTPAFSAETVRAVRAGLVVLAGATLAGAATGKRYTGDTLGLIDTNGGGATFIPGNAAGSTANGAIYY